MTAEGRACSVTVPPWLENPYRLVSLKEILMHFADDEFSFGRISNVLFFLGCIEGAQNGVGQYDRLHMKVVAKYCKDDLERFGLHASARSLEDVIGILDGTHPSQNLRDFALVARTHLMGELEATLFRHVEPSNARFYREPRRDWEEIIDRFPDTVFDIEECGKCFALGRYPASVFHSLQVVEHGLLSLGEFMGVADPKSGFTAVANALQRVKTKKREDLTDFEKKHFAFFEQMHGSVHAIKDAWRNKVNHAQGKLVLMTTDFSAAVAQEIYMATRAFMRRLATEMPS